MYQILDAIRNLSEKHDRVKKYVHTAWRVPLPRWGQYMMGCVYFSIPVIGGYQVMQWAISKSHESIGPRGEKLKIKEVHGIGDETKIHGETTKVGAGGLGMGVKLSVSDAKDQERSKNMLKKFLKKHRKKDAQLEEKGKHISQTKKE